MKIERPKTIFGKYPYYREQRKLVLLSDLITRGAGAMDMRLIGVGISTEWVPEHMRKKKSTEFFKKAKDLLVEMGV